MKNLLSGLLMAISLLSLFSAHSPAQKPDLPMPPNGIWLRDSLFIDETEIANIHWLEFMAFTQDSGMLYAKLLLPDTLGWLRQFEADTAEEKLTNKEYLSYSYLRYPGFRFFPVVGISYEQAVEFCKWRSKVVNQNWRKKPDKWKHYNVEYIFRLPTEEEWEFAAWGGVTDNPYGFTNVKRSMEDGFNDADKDFYKSKYIREFLRSLDTILSWPQFKTYINAYYEQHPFYARGNYCMKNPPFYENFRHKDSTEVALKITKWIYDYPPNDRGLYNMIGNVAEMVQEKSIAKGGSWVDFLEDCAIDTDKTYERPEAWLGFRCVCEVRVRRK